MRNRRRSILTICSVGASLCLLGVLMAIYHAFFFTPPTPEQARRLVTRNRISLANVMPIAYRDKITRVPGVQEVMVIAVVRRSLQRTEEHVRALRHRTRSPLHRHAGTQALT